jgi:Flp pilus assembly pilin Flp
VLKPLPAVHEVVTVNGTIEAQYDGDDAAAAAILQALIAAGIKVSGFSQLEGGLEDAFMKATSEDI